MRVRHDAGLPAARGVRVFPACRAAGRRVVLPHPVKEQQPHHRRERHAGRPGQAHQHDDGQRPQVAACHHEQQCRGQQEQVQRLGVGHLEHRGHRKGGNEHRSPERSPVRCLVPEQPVDDQRRAQPAHHGDKGQAERRGQPGHARDHPAQHGEERIERPGVLLDVSGPVGRKDFRVAVLEDLAVPAGIPDIDEGPIIRLGGKPGVHALVQGGGHEDAGTDEPGGDIEAAHLDPPGPARRPGRSCRDAAPGRGGQVPRPGVAGSVCRLPAAVPLHRRRNLRLWGVAAHGARSGPCRRRPSSAPRSAIFRSLAASWSRSSSSTWSTWSIR